MKTPYVNPQRTLEFFRQAFKSEQGDLARQYLASRQIELSTVELFQVGYCPIAYLGYGAWKRRVIFPLVDAYQNCIGFSGRLLTQKVKDEYDNEWVLELGTNRPLRVNYKNGEKWESDDRILYHDAIPKSSYLFGFNETKKYIKKENFVVVVEGQFDFLSMYQSGIKNVVGMLSATLTEHHITMLSRYCDFIIFMFDADDAGFKALQRTGNSITMNYDFIRLPDGYDPHDFIVKHGIDPIKYGIETALKRKDSLYLDKEKEELQAVIALLK